MEGRVYEDMIPVAVLPPQDINNQTVVVPGGSLHAIPGSGGIDMSLWLELYIFVVLGAQNGSAADTFALQDCPTSGGSYTAITGKTFTTAAGSLANTVQYTNLPESELNPGARYVQLALTAAAYSSLACVVILGKAKQRPATDNAPSASVAGYDLT
jgi:hypothetical protein